MYYVKSSAISRDSVLRHYHPDILPSFHNRMPAVAAAKIMIHSSASFTILPNGTRRVTSADSGRISIMARSRTSTPLFTM